MECDEICYKKIAPNTRLGVDFWGPEAAGGHFRPKWGKQFSISPPGSGPMYAIVYPSFGVCVPGPGARGPGPGQCLVFWVNHSIHGPGPGRRYRNFCSPVSAWNGLRRPRDPKNRPRTVYLERFLTNFIKFHCNRTFFWVGGSGGPCML